MTEREQRVPADLSPEELRDLADGMGDFYALKLNNGVGKRATTAQEDAIATALRFMADALEPSAEMVERAARVISDDELNDGPLHEAGCTECDGFRIVAREVLAAIVGGPDAKH